MKSPGHSCWLQAAAFATACLAPGALQAGSDGPVERLRAVLVSADQVTPQVIQAAKERGNNALVLELKTTSGEDAAREASAAKRIQRAGLRLYYWIEIGRSPQLADAHPEWMAGLQGHPEWRRLFPDFPQPAPDEVVKVYPWVPILYRESFDAHLRRVEGLLERKPEPHAIFLNDLQGAPSACGCGNSLCRWTADYGPLKTATPAGDDAARQFVAAAGQRAPESRIIPVWVTECEEQDGASDGPCAGVGCFHGTCWKAYTRQLMPLAEECQTLAVLLPLRALERDLPRYGRPAGWITHALGTFQTMPPRRGGKAVPSSRLIAVLQGWDVKESDIEAQIKRTEESNTAGYVVSLVRIEQSWEPRLIKRRPD